MSFGINGPDNKPVIREAQSMFNNGGGGNLGYFQQQKKKKDEDENDILELSSQKKDEEDNDSEDFSLDAIGSKIKNFWMKMNSPKAEENEKEENLDENKIFTDDGSEKQE